MKYACYDKSGAYIGNVIGTDDKDALARARALNEDIVKVSKGAPEKKVSEKKSAQEPK